MNSQNIKSMAANPSQSESMGKWDASQIKQPGWHHVAQAFIDGAREARANTDADDAIFQRAADAYSKQIFEQIDPESERRLREEDWSEPVKIDFDDDCRATEGPLLEFDHLLARFHLAVWGAASDADEGIAYDEAGVEEAKSLQKHIREMLRQTAEIVASSKPPRVTGHAMEALRAFRKATIMGSLHTIEKAMINHLAQAGALESVGFGKHRLTEYGLWLLDAAMERKT